MYAKSLRQLRHTTLLNRESQNYRPNKSNFETRRASSSVNKLIPKKLQENHEIMTLMNVRFEVLTAVTWHVTPCRLVEVYIPLGGMSKNKPTSKEDSNLQNLHSWCWCCWQCSDKWQINPACYYLRRISLLTSKMLASCEISRAYTPPDAPITYSSGSSIDVPSDPVTRKHCFDMSGVICGRDLFQGTNSAFVWKD
jgi:hypothetical protein